MRETWGEIIIKFKVLNDFRSLRDFGAQPLGSSEKDMVSQPGALLSQIRAVFSSSVGKLKDGGRHMKSVTDTEVSLYSVAPIRNSITCQAWPGVARRGQASGVKTGDQCSIVSSTQFIGAEALVWNERRRPSADVRTK